MRVFISWSGDRSKRVADVLRRWVPGVLQAVRPYFSPDDVAKGSRWSSEIAKELEASRVGLLVLTRDNLQAPWLMFEAGALAKNLDKSKVCPLLFDLEPTDVTGPLVQFQASRFDKSEMKRVVKMINAELADGALAGEVLDSVFEMWWPQLEKDVQQELARAGQQEEGQRSERDLMEEVLGLVRSLARDSRLRPGFERGALEDLVGRYVALVKATQAGPASADIVAAVHALERPIVFIARRSVGSFRASRLLHDLEEAGILVPSVSVPVEPKSS